MGYRDLREYLNALKRIGKLKVIDREVDKDWEISAVGRVAFQSIPETERPALMFTNVKGYTGSVVFGILGGSRSIYAKALDTEFDQVQQKWSDAQNHPISPRVVDTGSCKENILKGDDIDIFKFPVPTWTVGKDPAPYLTSPFVFTKDPDTGVQNVGTYRVMLKERNKLGVWVNFVQHARKHVNQYNERNEPTPVAIVLGTDPSIGLCSVSRMIYGLDELSVAGGLRGEAVEVVKCETNDLLVPASAEIVIEGFFRPNFLEEEGPFGEYPGYMGPKAMSYVMDITCITHRNQPIYQAFLSQMPPSESSMIRSIGREAGIYKHLVSDLRLPVKDVHLLEAGGAAAYLAISMKKEHEGQVRQVMLAAWSVDPTLGKFCVVVDDDIDVRDQFMLNWALSWRVQPHKDVFIIEDLPAVRLDPSQAADDVPQLDASRRVSSKMGIDATRKHQFPPIALPPQEHLDLVRSRWSEYWS
ncbi:UbiD family decarboxylase [Alicyclobacillus fastidiosus]|uniref:UbiD family decarboxylase n=1 Tax=Alicyclobacillus fastidiosus TaxID=392011 RepID=A0ABY6ZEI4_9BACL|nr:UbiD family decarboxylase [Alicyclobacillus fastidiosus]WAH40541.1 UbiD family decarboxylase [Alicyclobacillus fastidiosus]GMA61973.1 carboxylase [Alicyclobacillus fastidiosus]